jgi:hypothetical protein
VFIRVHPWPKLFFFLRHHLQPWVRQSRIVPRWKPVTQTFKNLRFAKPQPINYLQGPHHPKHTCANHPLCILTIGEEDHASRSPVAKSDRRAKFSPLATFKMFVFSKNWQKAGEIWPACPLSGRQR